MKYIVAKVDETLRRTHFLKVKQEYREFGALLELADDEIGEIKEKVAAIEPDYECVLKQVPFTTVEGIMQLPIIVATIGNRVDSMEVSYEYDLSSHKWKEKNIENQQIPWICCYSKERCIDASDYLLGIDQLHQIAQQLKRTLVVISHVESQLPYFRYHSLTQEIVNLYLETDKSIYINSIARKELYQYEYQANKKNKLNAKRMIYTSKSEDEIKSIIKKWFKEKKEVLLESKRQIPLYQDNFYDRIPPNQRIYVPINLLDNKECTYYQKLGLGTVCVGENYAFLYDERQKIDVFGREIVHGLLPTYMSPILTPACIQKEAAEPLKSYKQVSQNLKYLGENVYIGIIGTQGIDYRKSYLRNESGTTRVAGIWVQDEGNQGTYYTADQINEALSASDPSQRVPLPEQEEDETLVLQIAGGKDSQYEGIATRAEFIVAKVNEAPIAINEIYGGVENESGVLMPDVLVAVHKLMELARFNHKSLVIYLPYNTNISAHDGSSILEEILSRLARQQGCTFIIPTGEEGDKNHHSTLANQNNVLEQVFLEVKEQTPHLVGIIYIKHVQNSKFMLYTPTDKERAIPLERKAITYKDGSIIYSTGVLDDYNNGSQYILFSIENMMQGTWTIKMEQENAAQGKIDLWLSQQQLNPNVTLNPDNPFTTLGSNAAIEGLISVTGFDGRNLVVLGSAGRGFTWNGTVNPICAGRGVSVLSSDDGWKRVRGTGVAGGELLGSVACLYDKWQVEMGEPNANSAIMSNLILSNLYQFPSIAYPDRSQGYGIFQLEILPQLLGTPMR